MQTCSVSDAPRYRLWPSFWALVAVPVSAGLLLWGAIVPEEQYLKVKFGAEYERYAARVRRWL